MKTAIVGMGALGEKIYQNILPSCDEVILTHNRNKKYPDSRKFDFFVDDIKYVFGDEKMDLVFLTAKIEFEEDSQKLHDAMMRFLDACKNSRVVYVSSDGIFDGEQGRYDENDIPHPVTLYGRNLKLCEDLVKKYSDNYCIIRPNYLYSVEKKSMDGRTRRVAKDIEDGKKVVRFTDMYKSPMSYDQAAEAIARIALSDHTGIVHVSGERMSVYDFTKEILKAVGIPTNNLVGEAMPKERPIDFLSDTSLDASLMEKLTNIKALNIEESFEKYGNQTVDVGLLPKNYLR